MAERPYIKLPVCPYKIADRFDYSVIREALHEQYGVFNNELWADTQGLKLSAEDMYRFLFADHTELYAYVAEIFDCDDFADVMYFACKIYFRGSSNLGIVWKDGHAMCIFYDLDTGIFWQIEPQSRRDEWSRFEAIQRVRVRW